MAVSSFTRKNTELRRGLELREEARERQLSTLKQYQADATVTQTFGEGDKHEQEGAPLIGKEAGAVSL